MEIRLQKYLSQNGICSRRKGEEYIQKGLIKVNGRYVTTLGTKVTPGKDKIQIDGKIVKEKENLIYIKMNKPAGIVTTCAQKDEKAILDLIKIKERIFPVGRLDKDSEGLILLTNDGVLAYHLTHPRFEHEKEYVVIVADFIPDGVLDKLRKGLKIMGEKTQPARVKRVSRNSFSIVLKEGKNRQIRRMCQKVGQRVTKLTRVRIENILLADLPKGRWDHLDTKEKNTLLKKIKTRKEKIDEKVEEISEI